MSPGFAASSVWHHLAYTRRADRHAFLLDGRVVSQNDFPDPIDYASLGLEQSQLGGNPLGSDWQFAGRLDEASVWSRALADDEVRALWNRGALEAHYQVRACDDRRCAGEEFVGPDGDPNAWFSEPDDAGANVPAFYLAGVVPASRYIQYRVRLRTRDPSTTPVIERVTVHGVSR